jgi:hypothetical protein
MIGYRSKSNLDVVGEEFVIAGLHFIEVLYQKSDAIASITTQDSSNYYY